MDYFCRLVDGKQTQGAVAQGTERAGDNEIEMSANGSRRSSSKARRNSVKDE